MTNLFAFFRLTNSFFKRDFAIETSYRLAFTLNLGGVIISILTFFFISDIVGDINNEGYQDQVRYFPFVLLGISFMNFSDTAIISISGRIRNEQMLGTFETLFTSKHHPALILIASNAWDMSQTTLRVTLMMGLGIFLGAQFNWPNIPGLLLVFITALICFYSLGLIAVAAVIFFKKGNPFAIIYSSCAGLLGGVFYPVSILPDWLEPISWLLPTTHFLHAIRILFLEEVTFVELIPTLVKLGLFAIVLIPTSIICLKFSLNKVMSNGSLSHY